MAQIRSDLACEICTEIMENNPSPDGIECIKEKNGPLFPEWIRITNGNGERLSGKPKGSYLTLNTGRLWLDDIERFRKKLFSFASLLHRFLPPLPSGSSVLVAGLGNSGITADAIGPHTVKNLVITRHIRSERPLMFEDLGLFDLCAATPGVLGQTGIESADVVKSLVSVVRPSALIAVDALASRDPERLVTTVQLSDAGIRPGSGVGNERPELSFKSLGIPVISIGVPTVVDAATLAADAVLRFSGKAAEAEMIRREWKKSGLNFFVTPKETDQIIRVMGEFIGYGINLALNRDLSYEDMLSLVG